MHIPYQSTIRNWYATINGRPGLTSGSSIQIKVQQFQEKEN